jgi:hypothetical protein
MTTMPDQFQWALDIADEAMMDVLAAHCVIEGADRARPRYYPCAHNGREVATFAEAWWEVRQAVAWLVDQRGLFERGCDAHGEFVRSSRESWRSLGQRLERQFERFAPVAHADFDPDTKEGRSILRSLERQRK